MGDVCLDKLSLGTNDLASSLVPEVIYVVCTFQFGSKQLSSDDGCSINLKLPNRHACFLRCGNLKHLVCL